MKNIMIKVCGMRDVENIRAVAALGVASCPTMQATTCAVLAAV